MHGNSIWPYPLFSPVFKLLYYCIFDYSTKIIYDLLIEFFKIFRYNEGCNRIHLIICSKYTTPTCTKIALRIGSERNRKRTETSASELYD